MKIIPASIFLKLFSLKIYLGAKVRYFRRSEKKNDKRLFQNIGLIS